jgi:hypothetical protein
MMFHAEVGLRYWLADRDAPFRTFIGTGFGGTVFDATVPVTVTDCSYTDSGRSEACLSGREPGTRKQLVAVKELGFLFATARVGAAWYFADTQLLTLGLSAYVTFPEDLGFVFQPALGYGVEL